MKSTGASTRCAARIACALLGAIGGGQPVAEPVRRVVALGELGRQRIALVAGDAAQDAVDQPGEARGARVGFGVGDGEVDGGAVGDVEEQDLRRGDMQHMRELMRIGRQRPLEPRARPAAQIVPRNLQRRRQDGAHQRRGRACRARGSSGWPWSWSVRPSSGVLRVDDGGEQLCRRLARRQARDYFAGAAADRRAARPRSGRDLPCRVAPRQDHGPLKPLRGPVGLRPHGLASALRV